MRQEIKATASSGDMVRFEHLARKLVRQRMKAGQTTPDIEEIAAVLYASLLSVRTVLESILPPGQGLATFQALAEQAGRAVDTIQVEAPPPAPFDRRRPRR